MTSEDSEAGKRPRGSVGSETRAALLEAGAALLREQPIGAVLSQVTGRAVAARAGRTTGAFFHHWENQDSFHRDLLAYVLEPARIESTAEAVQGLIEGVRAGADPVDVLRATARANFESVRSDPQVPVWFAMWLKHGDDERVAELLRDNYRGVTGQLVPVLEALLDASGRTMRPPMTVETLAVSFTALVQGLALRQPVDPESVPIGSQHGEDWDLFSTLVVNLFLSSTTERDSAS